MRCVPARPPAALIVTVLLSFLAGPLLGLQLADRMAEDSGLAHALSVFVFPLTWASGLLLWLGVGVLRVVLQALWRLGRGRLREGAPGVDEALVPPGYGAFPVLGLFAAGFAGCVTALATDTPWWVALPVYAACGAGYGLALRQLAHHGYLPFPEPE